MKVDAKLREVCPGLEDEHRIVAQWQDPSEFLSDTVPVYIDPADPRRYLIDTSVLPSPGNAPDPDEPE